MSKNKISLIILILAVIVAVGFWVSKEGSKVVEKPTTEKPTTTTPPPKPVASNIKQFGAAVTLKLNEKATFSDGLVVILTEIDDSRCKDGVQCVWEGEVSAALEVSAGKLKYPGEVRVGTVTNKVVNPEDYTITLKNADAKSATIIVTYKKS